MPEEKNDMNCTYQTSDFCFREGTPLLGILFNLARLLSAADFTYKYISGFIFHLSVDS